MIIFRNLALLFFKKSEAESEKVFVENNYKAICPISTPSLKENNDNKTYKHTTIDFVNDDCLAEIFMYVPACERPKIALVCQKWNSVLDYSWGNVKKLQITHWEYNEYPNCLEEYPTPTGKLSFLKSLLNKCGCYLTQLNLTAYGHSDIVPVINEYCPNLVKLRLRFTHDDDKISDRAFSRLSKLKVLTVIFQHITDKYISLNLIAALSPVADTLTDLIIYNWNENVHEPSYLPESIVLVLDRLKALKRLEIGGLQFCLELIEFLKNNRTVEFYYHDYYIQKRGSEPNQLMSITEVFLLHCEVSDDCFYSIANTMKQLATIVTKCKLITNDGVVAISKMNNLKILYFMDVNNSIDSSSIKLLKNLTKLQLPYSNKMTDDLATKVLENSPKMDLLLVTNTSVTVEFIKKAAEISRNRKQHMLLGVTCVVDSKQYNSPYFEVDIIPNFDDN